MLGRRWSNGLFSWGPGPTSCKMSGIFCGCSWLQWSPSLGLFVAWRVGSGLRPIIPQSSALCHLPIMKQALMGAHFFMKYGILLSHYKNIQKSCFWHGKMVAVNMYCLYRLKIVAHQGCAIGTSVCIESRWCLEGFRLILGPSCGEVPCPYRLPRIVQSYSNWYIYIYIYFDISICIYIYIYISLFIYT